MVASGQLGWFLPSVLPIPRQGKQVKGVFLVFCFLGFFGGVWEKSYMHGVCACGDRGGHWVSCFTALCFILYISSLNPEKPASPSDPLVSVHSSAGVVSYGCPAVLFTWVLGNPNLGLPAGAANAPPTEPRSAQPCSGLRES